MRHENSAKHREHLEKAVAHFRRYRALAGNDDPKGRSTALAHLTEILSAEGLNRLEEAESAAREWVKEAPEDVSAYHAL